MNKEDGGACFCPQFTLQPWNVAAHRRRHVPTPPPNLRAILLRLDVLQSSHVAAAMRAALAADFSLGTVSDAVLVAFEGAEAEYMRREIELRTEELVAIVGNAVIARFELALLLDELEVPVRRGLEGFPGLRFAGQRPAPG